MTTTKRLYFLDSIRGFAALSVVASHFFLGFGLPPALEWMQKTPARSLWHGEGAVVFFFTLSGLVLAFPKTYRFTHYLLSHCFRILPLLFASIILSLVSQKLLFHNYITIPNESGWLLWFWRLPLTPKGILELLPQAWTLGIELPVSILIPSVTILTKQKMLWVLTFALLGLVIFKANLYIYIFDFLIGILISLYANLFVRVWKRWNPLIRFSCLALGFFLYSSESVILISAGCLVLLLSVLSSKRLQDLLSQRILLLIGKLSYSVYLLHFIVLLCFTPLFIWLLNLLGLKDAYTTRILGLGATMFLTLVISKVSYQVIEKPFMALGKRIV